MIVSLLKDLVNLQALKPEEVGPIYSDLLIRVHKYNSMNVQNNLQNLVDDIRASQSDAIRMTDIKSLSNQSILNAFLNSLPPTVSMGQHNYEAFKQTLRLFVNETPNAIVFKSGFQTMLQVNISGVHTINLNDAFKNLNSFWGVVLTGDSIPGEISSRLSANTRVLLYFLAPFTNDNTFTADTFISALMKLYRLTVSASLDFPEETEWEVAETAHSVGTNSLNLTSTLGYLLKNREDEIVNPKTLSPRQTQILRFVQKSLSDRIDRNNEDPEEALQTLSYSFAPSFYEENGPFIRRLISYMEIALHNSPTYFREIYSNKFWTPPASFWTQNYADFFSEKPRQLFQNAVETDPFNIDFVDRGYLEQDEDYESALPPSTAQPSVITAHNSEYSAVPVSPFNPLRDRIRESITKAVIPPLTGYMGKQIGESILPGSGDIIAPAASLVAAQLLDSRYNHRRERLKEAAQKRHRYIREAATPMDSKSDISDDTVITPIFGHGTKAACNKYSHLQPKGGFNFY
ncbi:pIIIa [Bovine adenovirus 6]|uniref:PIIIa n=1 Tax=Bovine adenovirus 6 TaxID=111167 RepID=K9MNK0_9ADEN|nr:pIIIa [Bovine adenovirus 6]AFV70637.1 pIIIa [Bovine adenovirus 6]